MWWRKRKQSGEPVDDTDSALRQMGVSREDVAGELRSQEVVRLLEDIKEGQREMTEYLRQMAERQGV